LSTSASTTSSLFKPIQDSLNQQKIAPFSIDNSRRRRLMLSFGGKSAWPYTGVQTSPATLVKKVT
jgi:hypothetical protein